MMMRCRLGIVGTILVLAISGEATAAVDSAKGAFVLSNEQVRVAIAQVGGRVVSFVDGSSGADFVRAAEQADAPSGAGLFCDRIQPSRGPVDRTLEYYEYQVVGSGTDARGTSWVEFRRPAKNLTVCKRFSLPSGSRRLTVDYALTNPGVQTFAGRFWSCSVATVGADGRGTLWFPSGTPAEDLKADELKNGFPYDPAKATVANRFLRDPKGDAMALTGAGDGAVVVEFPYPVLKEVYSFASDLTMQKDNRPSIEWFSDEFALKPFAECAEYGNKHPEVVRPEDLFTLRFSMAVELQPKARAIARVRKPATAKKNRSFSTRLPVAPVYEDWQDEVVPFLAGQKSKIRVLALGLIHASSELLEFKRRFDCDLTIVELAHPHVMWNEGTSPHYSWEVPEPAAALAKALEGQYDVILSAGITERSIPADAREKIVRMVESGTGFVSVAVPNAFPSLITGGEVFKPLGVPVETLPFAFGETLVSKHGQGRVAWVKVNADRCGYQWTRENALVPYQVTPQLNRGFALELSFAYCGKILQWAANREPVARIVGTGDRTVTVVSGRAGRCKLGYQSGQTQVFSREVVLAAGTNELPVTWADLPPNRLTYDVLRLLRGDYFIVARQRRDPNGFDGFELSATRFAAGASVTGRMTTRGRGRVVLELTDVHGRVLARQAVEVPAAGTTDFALVPEASRMGCWALCRGRFVADGREVDVREADVVFDGIPERKLNFIVWEPQVNVCFSQPRLLKDIGFDVITCSTNPDPRLWDSRESILAKMRVGFRIEPLGMCALRCLDLKARERKPCLRDPSFQEKVRADVAKTVDYFRPYCPFGYCTGDENSVGNYDSPHDMCLAPACLGGFRKAMEAKYRMIGDLNAAWGTHYASFGEIVPDALDAATKNGRPASWFDHRLYMMGAIPSVFSAAKDALLANDPSARMAVSGQLMTGVHNCFDWKGAMRSLDIPLAYIRPTDILPDMIRSWRTGEGGGGWIGYLSPHSTIRWRYYDMIANGLTNPGYWWGAYLARRGDDRLSLRGEKLKETLSEIRETGCEELFVGLKPVPSRVAIVHSMPSFVASAVVHPEEWLIPTTWTESLRSWAGLVRDIGFGQPDVVDAGDLGSADLGRYELVILPLMLSVSEAELRELEAYVRRGGRILVDQFFGLYDDRLAKRAAAPEIVSSPQCRRYLDRILAYAAYRDRPRASQFWRNSAWQKLGEMGLTTDIRLHPGSNCRETRDGDGRYFLVTQLPTEENGESVIPLGRTMHLYDLMHHRPLGEACELRYALTSEDCCAYAALPEKLSSVSLSCERSGRQLACRLSSQERSLRLVRLTLWRGETRLSGYDRNVCLKDGRGETRFDLGLDGDASAVEIRCLDLFTGEMLRR